MTSNVRKEFEKNSQQTKGLETKLEQLEQKMETTSKELDKKLESKFEEIERKLESNFETTKNLEDKLEEILRILKPEWDSTIQFEQMYIGWISSTRLQHSFSYSEFIFIKYRLFTTWNMNFRIIREGFNFFLFVRFTCIYKKIIFRVTACASMQATL